MSLNILYIASDFESIDDYQYYAESQIAINNMNITLELLDKQMEYNVYAEAAGFIGMIIAFFKTAITFILKLFLGFKGLAIAIIVGLVGYIIKMSMKKESSGGGGGGGGGSSTPVSVTIPNEVKVAEAKAEEIQKVIEEAPAVKAVPDTEILKAVEEMKIQADKKPLKEEKSMKDIRSAIARIISNEVTVDMNDPELEVSVSIPKTLERTVINTLNECIRNDKRVISSKGTYSEILKKKPLFYLSRDRKFLEDLRRNYFSDDNRAGAGAFSACLVRYTDVLAAVTGITYAVKAIANSSNSDMSNITTSEELIKKLTKDVLDDFKNADGEFAKNNQVCSRIKDAIKNLFEKPNSASAFSRGEGITNKIVCETIQYRPTVDKLFSDVTPVLSKVLSSKEVLDDRMFKVKSIESIGRSVRIIPDYSDRDMNWLRTVNNIVELFKKGNRDTNTIKRTIDALMEDNKEIQKEIEKMASSSINTFEFAEKHKIESLMGFRERIKKLSIEMLKENMAVMSFITLSIQIFGKQIENKTHPIFKALQEDILDICIALGINSVPDDYMTYTKDDYSIEIKR